MARKKRKPKSKPVRLSDELVAYIEKRREPKQEDKPELESIDYVARRLFGIPTRKGVKQSLKTYFVLTKPELMIFRGKAEARGGAIVQAVRQGRSKVLEKAMQVKEMP